MNDSQFSGFCSNCRKSLDSIENILFVEKEVGRCFCAEECIVAYFEPTVSLYEEELEKFRQTWDFSAEESAKLSHYRNLVLGDPDEIWMDRSESGDYTYTFIAKFQMKEEELHFVVITLAIQGHPSFVLLSFPTKDEDLLDVYRRGEEIRLDVEELEEEPDVRDAEQALEEMSADIAAGGNARGGDRVEEEEEEVEESGAAVFERLYREMKQPSDIPISEFPKYQDHIEATIDESDEIWHFVDDEGNEWCTFITQYDTTDELESFMMVVVCEPTFESTTRSFEVVFAFPTHDAGLAQHFRKGVNSLNKRFGVGWPGSGRAA